MYKFYKRKGFTLAEVLITLAIIGVVAALTIPTVVQNYQKTQVITQLKKAYNALANTTSLAVAQEGPITGWEVYDYSATAPDGTNGSEYFVNKYLVPYLKVSKNCGTKTTDECAFKYSYLNSSTINSLDSSNARFYLNDGTLISLKMNISTNKYAFIYIDVNGQKKPNKWGRDIFTYAYYVTWPVLEGRFMPWCFERSIEDIKGAKSEAHMCYKGANGNCCAALIMKEGWQIKDDYPW